MQNSAEDHELVLRAVEGDRASFAAVVSQHYDMMFRVAWKLCGNREDAEDIAQDVCLRLGRSICTYSGDAKFSTWLYRVVLNAVRDHQRATASKQRKLDDWAVDPNRTDIQEPEGNAEDEALQELWIMVRKLAPKLRDAVMLIYGEGLSHGEAALALECAEGTVSWRINEAKKQLKVLMAPENQTTERAAIR